MDARDRDLYMERAAVLLEANSLESQFSFIGEASLPADNRHIFNV